MVNLSLHVFGLLQETGAPKTLVHLGVWMRGTLHTPYRKTISYHQGTASLLAARQMHSPLFHGVALCWIVCPFTYLC